MIIIDLIYNLALLVALIVVSGFIGQWWKPGLWGALLQGVFFGSAAVIGMLRPLILMKYPRIFTLTCNSGEKKVISFIPVALINGDQLRGF